MPHLTDEVELLAENVREATADERAHLEACEVCSRALGLAKQVHVILQSQAMPDAPADLVASTLTRVRRERWRAEQRLDLVFNLVVGCAGLLAVGTLWLVLSATGLSKLSADVALVVVAVVNEMVRQSLPALPTYALAVSVFLSGLALWWWAERGFEM